MVQRVLLAALLVSAAYFGDQQREVAQQRSLANQRFEDLFYAPPPEWLPVLSFGYDEALADLMWIKGLVYFGEALGHKTGVAHVFRYVDSMLALDPYFFRVYRWATTAGIYKTQTTVEDLRRAAEYAEMGAARFPDSGEMAWEAGSTILFELVPYLDDPGEKRRFRETAARYLEKAARLGAGPPWLALTTTKQLQALGQMDRALAHLEEIYLTTSDAELKRQLAQQISELRGKTFVEALRAETEQLHRRHQRMAPYMPLLLFEQVYPRTHHGRVDVAAHSPSSSP